VRDALADLPGIKRQPRSEQSRFKVSFYIDPDNAPCLEEIGSLLHQADLNVHLNLSFGQFLDVVPARASKGLALRYVADQWGIPLEHCLAAGGSGADEDMMRGNTLAVVVANRHNEELSQLTDTESIYFAEAALRRRHHGGHRALPLLRRLPSTRRDPDAEPRRSTRSVAARNDPARNLRNREDART
jgi:hypothetical protein